MAPPDDPTTAGSDCRFTLIRLRCWQARGLRVLADVVFVVSTLGEQIEGLSTYFRTQPIASLDAIPFSPPAEHERRRDRLSRIGPGERGERRRMSRPLIGAFWASRFNQDLRRLADLTVDLGRRYAVSLSEPAKSGGRSRRRGNRALRWTAVVWLSPDPESGAEGVNSGVSPLGAPPGASNTGSVRAGKLEPTLGFEPRTCCLRNSCSTAELCRPEGEYRCPPHESAIERSRSAVREHLEHVAQRSNS
jgi:hypothetical protein